MKKNSEVYFSVIIPLYNKKKYIKDTINSVLSQSYKNFEIIVLNDGSTDGSELIVEQMQKNDSRIRLINRKNGGVSVARNFAISKARYDYICLLDADDDWTPDFLQVISSMVTKFPKHKIFSLRHKIIEADGRMIYPPVGVDDNFCGELKDFIKLYTDYDGLIQTSSLCLEKKFFQSLGGFPKDKGNGEDIYLWLLYGIKTNLVFCNKICTYYYRDRENSHTSRMVYVELPYPFEYFLNYEKSDESKYLDQYLRKSAILHISGLKILGQTKTAIKHSFQLFKNSKLTGLVCLSIALIPNPILKGIKSLRDKRRSKNA
jgi:glycosyltransferase involved in cell wall biosynthesis